MIAAFKRLWTLLGTMPGAGRQATDNAGTAGDSARLPDEITGLAGAVAQLQLTAGALSDQLARVTEAQSALSQDIARIADDVRFVKRRTSIQLDDGAAITFLADETPIFVNTGDYFGPPVDLMNGGLYEETNLDVLLSFLKPDSTFVDIGANVGFFTLVLARRMSDRGRAWAFEPHPLLADLVQRTVNLNNLRHRVRVCNFGLSDQTGPREFQYPSRTLGGGRVAGPVVLKNASLVQSRTKPLDEVLAPGTRVDLVKIDVEKHEKNVLYGMRRVIGDSPDIAILFEKLTLDAGDEEDIDNFLKEVGLTLFVVLPDARLEAVTCDSFKALSGYFLAARPDAAMPLQRSFFTVYPEQIWVANPQRVVSRTEDALTIAVPPGECLFYGPYWFLKRGAWRIRLEGEINAPLYVTMNENAGQVVLGFVLEKGAHAHDFYVDHDLTHFQCLAHSMGEAVHAQIRALVFERR